MRQKRLESLVVSLSVKATLNHDFRVVSIIFLSIRILHVLDASVCIKEPPSYVFSNMRVNLLTSSQRKVIASR